MVAEDQRLDLPFPSEYTHSYLRKSVKSASVEGPPGKKGKNFYLLLPPPRGDTVVEKLGLQPGIHFRTVIEGPAN